MNFATDQVQQISSQVFHATENVTSLFVVPLALIRILIANLTGNSQYEYMGTLKGVILYFLLAHSFDWMLGILLTFPEHFAPSFAQINTATAQAHAEGVSVLPLSLHWVLESVIACLYFVAVYLNFAVTVLLSAMAPIVFLLCTVFSIGLGTKAFFALLIMVSSWPIVFAACAQMQALAQPLTGGDALGLSVFDMITSLFKIMGPISMSYFGMHSGAGQAVMGAFRSLSRSPGRIAKGVRTTGTIAASVPGGAAKAMDLSHRSYRGIRDKASRVLSRSRNLTPKSESANRYGRGPQGRTNSRNPEKDGES